jgi:hypothetical protein
MYDKPLNFDGYHPPLERDDVRHSRAASDWMIFGKHPVTGLVDVTDVEGSEVFVSLPQDIADDLLALRGKFVDDVLDTLNRHLKRQAA